MAHAYFQSHADLNDSYTWVKGHTTTAQVAQGIISEHNHAGNTMADHAANDATLTRDFDAANIAATEGFDAIDEAVAAHHAGQIENLDERRIDIEYQT